MQIVQGLLSYHEDFELKKVKRLYFLEQFMFPEN